MYKKIVVDSCRYCPLREYYPLKEATDVYICTHEATEGMKLEDLNIIHPDCPLEENKPSCTCHD